MKAYLVHGFGAYLVHGFGFVESTALVIANDANDAFHKLNKYLEEKKLLPVTHEKLNWIEISSPAPYLDIKLWKHPEWINTNKSVTLLHEI